MQDGKPVEITGNHVMEAFAVYPGQPGIVGTLYTNSAVTRRLQAKGIDFEHCDNGDAFVTQALLAKQAAGQNWTRGGEFTGHIIDTDWLSSGDGVRSAAWFAAWAVSQMQASFGEIARDMPMQPEKMLKIRAQGSYEGDIAADGGVQQAMQAERSFADDIRFVVRASGTEKGVVRVWAEGRSEELVSAAVERVGDAVLRVYIGD
jgi:phosphoglucosamine mutase